MAKIRRILVGEDDAISYDADVAGQIANIATNPHGDIEGAGGFDVDPIELALRMTGGAPAEVQPPVSPQRASLMGLLQRSKVNGQGR
jgi:hypothetical protein